MPDDIVLEEVTKTFPKLSIPALCNVNLKLSLQEGGRIGIVGPDGAGKSTLLRLLAGLLSPTKGSVHILGVDIEKDIKAIHDQIGYMPQKFGLYEDLTVLENLRLYADLQGVPKLLREERFSLLLSFSDLSSFQGRLAGKLSGGMKQKLGLACALIKKPKVLLLDEPTVGVDPLSRQELWQMVTNLIQEGVKVLWSTSYLDEAEQCDKVLLLHEGKVLFHGVPRELIETMRGRTFLVDGLLDKRKTLSVLSQDERVLDVSIYSEFLRLVIKKGEGPDFLQEGKILPCEPRLEDAFMEFLQKKDRVLFSVEELGEGFSKKKGVMIESKELCKSFDSFTAVKNISFQVHAGEVFGLLGPNGAGKSTTFKMLCGLLRPSTGGAYVSGMSLEKAPSIARGKVGYMAQKFSLYGSMSVLQNLRFFSGIYPIPMHLKDKAIASVIESFDLTSFLDQETDSLALGYKQRLALACALMHQPDVLFLDEPTAGVDPATRREFWGHINYFVRKGMTVMVTTHFLDEAEYCDKLGLILAGELIYLGSPSNLKASVRSAQLPSPTLEEAFLSLIREKKG